MANGPFALSEIALVSSRLSGLQQSGKSPRNRRDFELEDYRFKVVDMDVQRIDNLLITMKESNV